MKCFLSLCCLVFAVAVSAAALRVSDNGRCLVAADGQPFFWLGDTAWALLYRLNREETDRYLADRKAKRFNVIQAVILRGGVTDPNAYGHPALLSNDPAQPNERYFEHVDWVVNRAAALGFYMALLPTWGDNVVKSNSIFTADNARRYGEFLGRRYRDKPVVWVLGGDQNPKGFEAVWRAMADGLRSGHGGQALMTYHPRGGASSGQWFHREPWLAFNMIQSGHTRIRPAATDRLLLVRRDYARQPAKPVIDAESVYENIPEGLNKGGKRTPFDVVPANERITAYDVRVAAYGTVFSGAFGYTYGANGVFQMTRKGDPASWRWDPQRTWDEALQLPGAAQMQHLRALMESVPMLSRIPAPELVDGKGCVASRDANGIRAMVYSPSGKPFTMRMDKLAGAKLRASWFDPRTGKTTAIGEVSNNGERGFIPPASGNNLDWVLVLDEVGR